MEKTLLAQYTEKDYTLEQLIQLSKEKMIDARKNGLLVEFITTKPVLNAQNEVVGVTSDFPAELNIYTGCELELEEKADDQYIDWLENMLVMLSGNFMDLVKALKDINEDALKDIPLPNFNETRRAIRLISENAEVSNNHLEPEEIDVFTNKVITKHAKKTDEDYIKKLESLIEDGYTVKYHGSILDTAKINIRDYEVAVVHQERTIYATPKAIYEKIIKR